MADNWDSKTRRLFDELDRVVEDAEQVRAQVEASMRRPPCWPERTHPARWWTSSYDSDDNNHSA